MHKRIKTIACNQISKNIIDYHLKFKDKQKRNQIMKCLKNLILRQIKIVAKNKVKKIIQSSCE
jgi:uncharacterized protein YeeX (DUF496 family)